MFIRRYLVQSFITIIVFSANVRAQKIKGLSFVATRDLVTDTNINPIKETAANWVSLMPYGYMDAPNSTEIAFNLTWQWQGETNSGLQQAVPFFERDQISIMLKPHIWIKGGVFTGTIEFDSDEQWIKFQESYKKYILYFANVAQDLNIPILCIGTELQSLVSYDSKYWEELIKDIRSVYSGKLTYAENWDQYDKVPFWSQLDFIGIDAYFPLKASNPSLSDLLLLWKPYVKKLNDFSKDQERQILFTEMGYRSINSPNNKPWDYSKRDQPYNGQKQAEALEALFLSFENKAWWAGGFIWKWFPDHNRAGGISDTTFSPQNKPAEEVIRRYFTKWE